ncbi:MAG TPA: hypothetical protein VLV76_06945 [Candidatus Acidoferrum sp.]|nr:hypothetical protein [Candidatus Acidoferrum sp.]
MAQSELSTRRGDDAAELRARYNQLCAALTMSAGTNSAVAERVLQELQALAQKIAFRQAEQDSASRGPAAPAPQPPPPQAETRVHGKGNVIAFRCRVKGRARENPRLPAALSALTDRTPVVTFESIPERTPPASPISPQIARPTPPPDAPMVAAVARQGAELERLVRKSEDQSRILELLEGRLGTGEDSPQLSAEVAALRSAATRQGEQLMSLATAVHRLAKLLAAHPPQDRR